MPNGVHRFSRVDEHEILPYDFRATDEDDNEGVEVVFQDEKRAHFAKAVTIDLTED